MIFGFLTYVSSSLSESRLAQQREQLKKEFLTTTPIKYYITSCLHDAAENGLRLIGEQGGYIYDFQGGLITWNIPYITYNASGTLYNISYLIYRSNTTEDNSNAKILRPEMYPCLNPSLLPGPPECDSTCSAPTTCLPFPCCNAPLCMASSPLCDYCKFYGATCYKSYDHTLAEPGAGYFFDFGTIKDPTKQLKLDLLKSNISVALLNYYCGDQKSDDWHNNAECNYSIQRQLEYYLSKETKKCINLSIFTGYNLSDGDLSTNISFGVDDLLVSLEYPIIIRKKNQPTVDTTLYFSLPTQKIRLLKIYEDVIKKLITEKEIKYITFNLTEEIEKADTFLIANKIRYSDNATIIVINDTLSNLGAKPYIFQFAVENRGPALDYISSSKGYANGISCSVMGMDYDVCIAANNNIVLKPQGYDPDDDFLTYSYSGWHNVDFLNSNLYRNGATPDCSDKRRCAAYTPTISDQGGHNLTITIYDGKYTDSQKVEIYVS